MVPSGSLFGARYRAGAGLRERRGAGGVVIFEADPAAKAAPVAEQWPFQGYRSKYTGTGDPPEDQAFRVRVRLGAVNNRIPTNINEEFVCLRSGTILFWVQANFDEHPSLLGCVIDKGGDQPADPAGGPDSPPMHSYCLLFKVETDEDGIVSIEPFRKSSLNVTAVVTNFGCEDNTLAWQWT